MDKLSALSTWAREHGVDPKVYVAVWIISWPISVAAIGWLVAGLAGRMGLLDLSVRLAAAIATWFAPSLYILIFGKNLPKWMYVLLLLIMAIPASIRLGWLGFLSATVVTFGFYLGKEVRPWRLSGK